MMTEKPKATHYCDKCKRRFVYVHPSSSVDPFPGKDGQNWPCGGLLLPMPSTGFIPEIKQAEKLARTT